ncbi:transcriptional regulator, ArsR family [Jannaschia faecimaris]|uniref:Transcriptional regulator, ArsR family n=1 Tax=Jannaschia faecimaris TaxID=1244108 RepID=A0A1H3L7H2_9RHOB|nr:metalloregulator ArsR/SmtB family transcription factor [Jannaschia faecimaris]SDY59845.1 transcriptional regulator, ArsR family [Jannaschia faecimaris]
MSDGQQLGFRALADPTRRDILRLLAHREMTIAEVADNFAITRAAVKKHLTVLHEGQLITTETRGRTRVNALAPGGLKQVASWFGYFDTFWDEKLSNLKDAIEKDIQ